MRLVVSVYYLFVFLFVRPFLFEQFHCWSQRSKVESKSHFSSGAKWSLGVVDMVVLSLPSTAKSPMKPNSSTPVKVHMGLCMLCVGQEKFLQMAWLANSNYTCII